MPADAVPGGSDATPPPPPAETVGVDGVGGVADRGRSEPNEARFCGGGAAIIGPGEPCDAAGAGGGVWLVMGAPAAAGGDAEAGADAGVICGSPEIVEGFLCRFRLGLGFPDLVVDGR